MRWAFVTFQFEGLGECWINQKNRLCCWILTGAPGLPRSQHEKNRKKNPDVCDPHFLTGLTNHRKADLVQWQKALPRAQSHSSPENK